MQVETITDDGIEALVEFQSLIHQGKNASFWNGPLWRDRPAWTSFNPLFIRGKMQACVSVSPADAPLARSFNPLFIRGKMQEWFFFDQQTSQFCAVSIPYSSGEKCKLSKLLSSDIERVVVSIPYSSGEKCKLTMDTVQHWRRKRRFQSLIHQGKNASAGHRALIVCKKTDVSIPYSSGEKCKNSRCAAAFVMFLSPVSIPYSSGEKCKTAAEML